jgi:DNA repair protein RadC
MSAVVAQLSLPLDYAALSREADDAIVARAMEIVERRMKVPAGVVFAAPDAVRHWLVMHFADAVHQEHFTVLFLDAQHRLIAPQRMFSGTLTQTSVYPREVVRVALELGAASVVLSHNHPSGSPEPSRADELLTQTLKASLALVDCRVLDHVIVSGKATLSMAEKGLL